MSGWTAARARRLDEIAGPDGVIVGAAVDHRDSLRAAMAKKGMPAPSDVELSNLKVQIAAALAPAATIVLLDAETSAAQALAMGALPGDVALGVPLEAQGYEDADVPVTTFLAGWSPAQAVRLGASACKLLLPYRVDEPEQVAAQDAVVRRAVAECRAAGVALILEPIAAKQELIVEGARRLAGFGPDVLKVQHPGSADACQELDEACGWAVPWVLLGGGADPETLERQVEEACRAGASGFVVGRTLWDGALESPDTLETVSRPLLERLGAVAREHATPWRERVGVFSAPVPGTLP